MPKINPKNITISAMLVLSQKLHQKHKADWPALKPHNAREEFLWLITELDEVLDIIKKDGEEAIMQHKKTRSEMIEEITDCFMYLADALNCYQYTAQEFSRVYCQKMRYNLKRDFKRPKKC